MARFDTHLWRGKHPLALLLLPLSWLYLLLVLARKLLYSKGLLPTRRVGAPVIVVGNLTAGGAGKTPLVIWLAQRLKARGHRPGALSRGYGGALAPGTARRVEPGDDPALVGDEPALLARRTGCPVAVCSSRVKAAEILLRGGECDILLCDDGLQHAALARDLEIVVVDGERGFGNGFFLPAGPLREPLSRLNTVDLVVVNAGAAGQGGAEGRFSALSAPSSPPHFLMEYVPLPARSLGDGRERALADFRGEKVHAVAGIGHPERFFSMLEACGIALERHAFPDHHSFRPADLAFAEAGGPSTLLMTEKDAVKCGGFRLENAWQVPVEARLSEDFERALERLLEQAGVGRPAARP